MKRKYIFIPMVVLCLALLTTPVFATQWQYLGERTVNHRAEKDTIRVGAKDGTFRRIKLQVKKSPIHLMDLKIHFANGDVQDVAIRNLIKAGGETRTIDLNGKQRVITKVTLRYRSLNAKKGKSKVRLFAKH